MLKFGPTMDPRRTLWESRPWKWRLWAGTRVFVYTNTSIADEAADAKVRSAIVLNRQQLWHENRTGQGPCRANLHKWGLAQSPSCDCGQRDTMNHIVDTCPLTTFEGGRNLLLEADDDAVTWLESTATAALRNK